MNLSPSSLLSTQPATGLRPHPALRADAEAPGGFEEGFMACLSGDCAEPDLPKAAAPAPGPLVPPVQDIVASAAEATRFAVAKTLAAPVLPEGPKGPEALAPQSLGSTLAPETPRVLETTPVSDPATAPNPATAGDGTADQATSDAEADQAVPVLSSEDTLGPVTETAPGSASQTDANLSVPENPRAAPKRDGVRAKDQPEGKAPAAPADDTRPAPVVDQGAIVPLALGADPGGRAAAGSENPPRTGAGRSGDQPRAEVKAGAAHPGAEPALARSVPAQTGAKGLVAAAPALPDVPPQTNAPAQGTLPPMAGPEALGPAPAASGPAPVAPLAMTQRTDWPQAVVSTTLSTLTPDGGTMVLELAPEELGALTITLTLEGDTATVSIQTETPEAARALNEGQRELAQDFARHGVTLTAHDAQTGRRGDARPDPGGSTGNAPDDDPLSDPAVHVPPQGILNLIA